MIDINTEINDFVNLYAGDVDVTKRGYGGRGYRNNERLGLIGDDPVIRQFVALMLIELVDEHISDIINAVGDFETEKAHRDRIRNLIDVLSNYKENSVGPMHVYYFPRVPYQESEH